MNEIVKTAVEILTAAHSKKEPVQMHCLIWTIDAKHHALATRDELNDALLQSGPFRIESRNFEVTMIPADSGGPSAIAAQEYAQACSTYTSRASITWTRISRPKP